MNDSNQTTHETVVVEIPAEIDTPWFDPEWLDRHHDFPLDPRAAHTASTTTEVAA